MTPTAFLDHPAYHLTCVYCREHVTVDEAMKHPSQPSYPKFSIHLGECLEKWDGLDASTRQEYRLIHEISRRRLADEYEKSATEEDDAYWRKVCEEIPKLFFLTGEF